MALAPVSARKVLVALRIHPRVAYQGLYTSDETKDSLLEGLPPIVPFRHEYAGGIGIIDWDHRLPSQKITLRIYLFFDPQAFAIGESAFDERLEEIGVRDTFPEFDVPDFGDLPADEVYEADLDVDGVAREWRLLSPWRREVTDTEARDAVDIARGSAEYARVLAQATTRPRHLGDLETVSWVPPCESGHVRWTLDVWFLLAFDGRVGTGRSLLVDPTDRKVVKARDFSVRAS